MDTPAPAPKLQFDTHPSKYRHWILAVDGEVAKLSMKVQPFGGANSELELKSNSYDLSVDIELADAIQRLRFEHPGVKCCVIPARTTRSSAPAPTSTCWRRARIPSRSTSASTRTRRASRSRTLPRTVASASSPPATAPPRAAGTSWRWPATTSC